MVLVFVISSILLSILTDWYIFNVYCRPLPRKRTHFLCWTPSFLTAVSCLSILAFPDFMPASIVLLCVTVPKLMFVLVLFVLRRFRFFRKRPAVSGTVAGLAGLFLLGTTVYGATEGIRHFEVNDVVLYFDTLPDSFDGYRLVQISDIHSGSWPENSSALAEAVSIVNVQKADLVLFTGDIVNATASELLKTMGILGKIKAADGVFSVLGNHDYGTYAEWDSAEAEAANFDSLLVREKAMGWRLLDNEHVFVRRGNDSIAIIGVQNSGELPFPDYAELGSALHGTDGVFKVLMSHDPTHWRREVLPDTDIELTLSGHTHDMQFSLPGFSPARYFYPEHSGLYEEGGRMLYVNAGLGYLLPIRLGAWPEITVITLRCGPRP